MQFETWEKLHRKHARARIVTGPRRTWRLLRDMYTLSVVFLTSFLLVWLVNFQVPFAVTAPYLFVFGGQTLFLVLSARSMGWQLVNNVLGAELGIGPDRNRQNKERGRGK